MIDLNQIHSLSDFQRPAKEHLKERKRSGKPRGLTVNGKAELVVQDARSYQRILDRLEQVAVVDTLWQRLASLTGQRTPAAADVFGVAELGSSACGLKKN